MEDVTGERDPQDPSDSWRGLHETQTVVLNSKLMFGCRFLGTQRACRISRIYFSFRPPNPNIYSRTLGAVLTSLRRSQVGLQSTKNLKVSVFGQKCPLANRGFVQRLGLTWLNLQLWIPMILWITLIYKVYGGYGGVISDAILNCFDLPRLAGRLAGEAAIRATMKGKSQWKPSGEASTRTSQRVRCKYCDRNASTDANLMHMWQQHVFDRKLCAVCIQVHPSASKCIQVHIWLPFLGPIWALSMSA